MLENSRPFPVLNLPVHLLTDYTGWLLNRLENKQGTHVVTLNAEMAMLAQEDPTVAGIIQKADLVIPDGAGIILYLRWRGQKQKRCPGIELAQSLLLKIEHLREPCPVAFYGGKPGIAEQAANRWQEKIPGLSIMTNHGYLNEQEQQQWLQTLQQKQPKLILVGLGVPRQEFWIQQHRYLCPDSIWIGVGGSFDIWSGAKTRAPGWLRDNNLEWLYRLYQEPWRWRRMLALPQFFWHSLKF
ncbi:WecB/TagA/CpsF family glycosyltransferase [Gloeothece citriformis]|uniref:WecB/TagA/CpsF family glycosyltransferase n=1 Tax=Gloeothece citriformis TaxID=2546356 RepID=UPI003B8355AB